MSQDIPSSFLSSATPSNLFQESEVERGRPRFRLPGFLQGSRALLWLVAVVVVVVSLPLLQAIALRENEMDALRALRLIGGEVHAAQTEGSSSSSKLPPEFSNLFAPGTDLSRQLPDSKLLDTGRLLLNHGYLFVWVRVPGSAPVLRAWPMAHGETGLGAFLWEGPGKIIGHPNANAQWTGIEKVGDWPRAARGESETLWRSIELSANRDLLAQ